MTQPLPPDPDGRDGRGRFAAGNHCGQGNPSHRRMARLRRGLLAAVSVEDIQAITAALLTQAKNGDTQAAKLLLEYAIGKPTQPIEVAGPEGQPLAVNSADLQIELYQAVCDLPEARVRLAAVLRRLALGNDHAADAD